jgi:hypothetical protein
MQRIPGKRTAVLVEVKRNLYTIPGRRRKKQRDGYWSVRHVSDEYLKTHDVRLLEETPVDTEQETEIGEPDK